MSAKEQILLSIQAIPDGLSWEEIIEELEIAAAIRQADEDITAGNFVTQEEMKREVES